MSAEPKMEMVVSDINLVGVDLICICFAVDFGDSCRIQLVPVRLPDLM